MKTNYTKPDTVRTRVELESPICGGSAVIQNPENTPYEIEDQKVNDKFDYTPKDNNWEDN